ncbi:hypothetical protein M2H39_21675 [Vibrio vulnificus]|uniref:hypothetical protein n=1 Tax=Vibrio vulnificus TaxID=672 RepID=UPI001D7BC50F|nr:hypothetical protein [Vibrio vulnificus]EGR7978110.1 hypothetical protein [Vibrio vulnificus]EJA3105451.1 hypothetical protein [Vibrio vulnificus]MCG9651794.1 hypothetical protein [Vibrio vulnificus]MCU8111794.1 hypothetical protein [Vibrio vulnificus]
MRVQKSKIGADPVKYYASLIGMEKHESCLKKQVNAIPIMTGIVLYRQLPKNKQSQILKQILGLSDNQLKASLYGLVSQVVANPYWFSWSLSDSELREFFETNKGVTDALKVVGLDITVPLTVAGVAAFLYSANEKGLIGAAQKASVQLKKTVTSSPVAQVGMKMGLTKQAASLASAILVVMVTVIAYQTNSNTKDAQKELLRRGLLKADDL